MFQAMDIGKHVELSIVIISWNTRELLLDCIRSLKNLRVPGGYQIIVIDNASSDESAKAVREAFPDVVVVENTTNLGFAKANNLAIEQSKSEYICLVNSDVIVLNGCIEALLKYMKEHTDVGVIGPKLLNGDGSFQLSCKRFPTVWRTLCVALGLHRVFPNLPLFCGTEMTDLDENTTQDVEAIAGAFLLARRSAIDQVGLLDEDFFFYGEDIDWCKRFHNAGFRVTYYPLAKSIHLGGASSSKDSLRFNQELYRAKLLYWKKHHSDVDRLLFLLIMINHLTLRIIITIIKKIFNKSKNIYVKDTISSYSKLVSFFCKNLWANHF